MILFIAVTTNKIVLVKIIKDKINIIYDLLFSLFITYEEIFIPKYEEIPEIIKQIILYIGNILPELIY